MSRRENRTLPKDFTPTHYCIELHDINTTSNVFFGSVAIHLKCEVPSNRILLNTRDITVSTAVAELQDKSTIGIQSQSYDKVDEVLKLEFASQLSDDVILHINYSGILQTNMSGFYRSDFLNTNTGEPQFMLSTQFEATDARRAFPCFDEPELKATFDVSIVAPSNYTVLSNMPLLTSKKLTEHDLIMHRFHTTPRMSTYLVAWALGEFEYIQTETTKDIYPTLDGYSTEDGSSKTQGKLPIRVYTAKGKAYQGKFALSVASKVIDFFSGLFEIPYPLPKLDLLCVETYSHNAMENFSLITFRPTALLYDGDVEVGDSLALQKIAYVVSHEIAHQWFGNLVTMKWWDELWLNEGFATWVGYYAVAEFFPEWDVPAMMMWKSHAVALELDSLKESHPVKVDVRNAKDIDQVFDSISYLKGCSILEMISGFLGESVFLKGVALYLERSKFGNSTMEDLFGCMGEIAGIDVLERLQNWILKIGFPLLTVSTVDGCQLKLTQERFLSTNTTSSETDHTTWWIPLMLNDGEQLKKLEFSSKEATLDLTPGGFKYFNNDAFGFYRTKYEDEVMFKVICQNLSKLSSRSIMGLISDVEITGSAEQLLQLLSYFTNFQNPEDYYVWTMILGSLASMFSLLHKKGGDRIAKGLNDFTLSLIENRIDEALEFLKDSNLVLMNKSDNKRALKAQFYERILLAAGNLSHKKVVNECTKLFESGKVTSTVRDIVLRTVLSQPDTSKATFEKVLEELSTATLTHKESILLALGEIKNADLFESCFVLLFIVEPMDVQFLAESWGRNPFIRDALWSFIKEQYEKIYERISINSVVIDRFIRFSLRDLVGSDVKEDVEAFFKNKNVEGFDRGVRQTLERIERNTKYAESNIEGVENFFGS